MSARSIVRAHERDAKRAARRSTRSRIKRTVGGATVAVGAAAAFAQPADAATFQVLNTGDAGADTLRQAILDANATAAPDTITFAPSVTGEITLTSGEIEIQAPVDIQGPGAGTLAVDGNDNSNIFDLDVGVVGDPRDPVSISGLTLRDGNQAGSGGAIYSYQTDVTLTGTILSGNEASSTGGAIDIEQSPIAIIDSAITGNYSNSGGGAMYTDGDNSATNVQDTVTIRNTLVAENEASGDGGAFYFDNATGGDVLIAASEIRDNTTGGTGGAFEFYGHKGSQTIRNSTISGNNASSDGGGIYFDSDYDDPDGLLVEGSTISGNFSGTRGGGIYVENSDGDGGKPVVFRNSTIANNTSTDVGGGIYRGDYDVTLSSTIVADNTSTGSDDDDLGEDPVATDQFTVGFSLIEGGLTNVTATEVPAGSNKTGVDPQLGALGDNGGPTSTHLPAAGSPAIDSGIANGLSIDQRGLPRTVDQSTVPDATGSDGTDIGSVERADDSPPPPDTTVEGAAASAKKTQKQGKKIKVKLTVAADEAVDVLAKGKVKAGKKNYRLKKVATALAGGDSDKVVLKPKSKRANKKIVKFLAKGRKAKAKLKAVFTDAAGNQVTDTAKVKLKQK